MNHATPQQSASALLMVRPANFGFNEQTAANNSFQSKNPKLNDTRVADLARQEFDHFVTELRAANIEVMVAQDSDSPAKSDAVFPNNWLSFHADGTVITYPMFSANRRLERRAEIIQQVAETFHIAQHHKLESAEAEQIYLEGTGSLVLDRVNRIAYACRSPRTHPQLVKHFCELTGYQQQLFNSRADAMDIYHTNVMMAVADQYAVVCLESVSDQVERQALVDRLEQTGKKIVAISMAQLHAFAGNMLQVQNREQQNYLLMSQQARDSLDPKQISVLASYNQILSSPIDTIEQYGGGSARCMLAEIFLPRR